MGELDILRRGGVRALAGVAWACAAVILLGSFWSSQGALPVILALAVTVVPSALAFMGRQDAMTRMMFGLTMPLYPAILLYQWSGTPWQVDIHMLFFALIAALAVMADWRTIVAAAAVTAVHHLLTNFLMPSLVFPNGANLERVVLHAVIVVLETGVLLWLTRSFETLVVSQARVREERQQLEEMAEQERAAQADEQNRIISAIGAAMGAMSEGDLDYRIDDNFSATYDQLRRDFNGACARLSETIAGLSRVASSVHTGSTEIRSASDDLARRTEQQASQLEQAAAAMASVTGMMQETARSASDAAESSNVASEEANSGVEIVDRAVATMNEIAKSSNEIAQITTLIDGIAFQTNLLALNAGVEAARAGDAGKGFAVVANEVRALAARSADAAKEIKDLIAKSGEQVRTGVAEVSETGEMLSRIIERVTDISDRITDISMSAEAGAQSLFKINEVVSSMESMTQQNAAMVEESAAASRSLAGQADELTGIVSSFRVDGGRGRAAAANSWSRAA